MTEKEKSGKTSGSTHEEKMEKIRSEIERTRSDMHRTVGELQDRLSPSHVKSELKEKVRNAAASKAKKTAEKVVQAGEGFLNILRENPVPAFLGGVGLGWLLIKGFSKGGEPEEDIPSTYLGRETYMEGNYSGGSYSEEHAVSGQNMYEKATKVGEDAGQEAGEYSEKVRRTIRDVSERAGQIRAKASEYAGVVQERASRARNMYSDALESNPFGVLMAVLALGTVVGLLIPSSEKERELGEQVASKATEAARETMEKVRSVAEEAKESTIRKAKEEGLIA